MFKLTVLSKLLFPAATLNVWRKCLHHLIGSGSASRRRMSLQNIQSETFNSSCASEQLHWSNNHDYKISVE